MSASEYESFRGEIKRLLELARDQLTAERQDRIRAAVAARRDDRKARRFIDYTQAEHLGHRLIKMTRDAGSKLGSAHVQKLDAQIDAGLARRD